MAAACRDIFRYEEKLSRGIVIEQLGVAAPHHGSSFNLQQGFAFGEMLVEKVVEEFVR